MFFFPKTPELVNHFQTIPFKSTHLEAGSRGSHRLSSWLRSPRRPPQRMWIYQKDHHRKETKRKMKKKTCGYSDCSPSFGLLAPKLGRWYQAWRITSGRWPTNSKANQRDIGDLVD